MIQFPRLILAFLLSGAVAYGRPTPVEPSVEKTGGPKTDKKPNILFIFTDDQQFMGYEANGNALIKTPFLNRLAEKGVRFTDAHAALSLCSPSRAAVLTGHYGSRNGVEALAVPLKKGETTFAQVLGKSGYQTLFCGKWHIRQKPEDVGFQKACYFDGNGSYIHRPVINEGKKVTPNEHIDLYCAKKSVEMIKNARSSDKPFILFHCTQLPHMNEKHTWPADIQFKKLYDWKNMPLPSNWNDDLTGKPPYLRTVRNKIEAEKYGYNNPDNIRKHCSDYYSVITEMDSYLSLLLQALKENGLEENTYVIFMSDNGWLLGDHGMTSKVLPYSASTHVPLVICGPGIDKGTSDLPCLNLDVTSTLYDLAGVKTPPSDLHGISLKPQLAKRKQEAQRTIVYECLKGYGGNDPILAAHDGHYLYIQTLDKTDHSKVAFEELYDEIGDPGETKNIVNEKSMKTVLPKLREAIENHRHTVLKN